MKKIISLILILVFVLTAFVGCNEKAGTSSKPDSSSDKTSSDATNSDNVSSEDTLLDDTSSDIMEDILNGSTDKIPSTNGSKISVPATTKKTFEALPAEYSILLNSNPDRGWRSEEIYTPDFLERYKEFIPAEHFMGSNLWDALVERRFDELVEEIMG